jgi:Fe-S-cluster containining protein
VQEVLGRLTKPVALAGLHYENPQQALQPYETVIREFEVLKGQKRLAAGIPFIVNEKQVPLARRQSLACWIRQQVLGQELEEINSTLCSPCGCVLCCTGPNSGFDALSGFKGRMKQEYFEIPLADSEVDLFMLARIDTEESRASSAQTLPPLRVNNVEFSQCEMGLYHWQNGWSLILPEGAVCPQLAKDTKRCKVYAKRPEVCRKPQIFPYVLEKTNDMAKRNDGVEIPVYMARNKVLAVWDCPYVRELQDVIGAYAEMSGLEPIFKRSKT